jgi:hypothetical protein
MTAGELLTCCRALGVDLAPGTGGALTWQADTDPPAGLLAEPLAHKGDVLRLLAGHPGVEDAAAEGTVSRLVRCTVAVDLTPDWYLLWNERAGIMQHDGGIPRERAEALALAEILRQMQATRCAADQKRGNRAEVTENGLGQGAVLHAVAEGQRPRGARVHR